MTREEAIKTIRLTCPKISDSECDFETAMRFLIPELAESEDERIREVIYKLMLGMREEIFTSQDEIVTKEKVLAYLEKQKEQKPLSTEEAELNALAFLSQMDYTCIPPKKEHQNNSDAPKNALGGALNSPLDKDKNLDDIAQDYVEAVKEYNPEPTWDLMQTAVCYGYHYRDGEEQKPADLPAGFYVTLDGKKYYTKEMRCNGMNVKVVEPKPAEWSEEDRLHYANILEALEYVKGCKSDYDKIEAIKSDIAWFKSIRPQPKQKRQIKEGDKVSIHCRKDRKEGIITIYDGKVGEVIHVWDAKRNPWGHIGVRLDNGCNDGFYEDELEVLDELSWKPSEEQQEVDLEKEIVDYWIATEWSKKITLGKFKVIARYFYGLGQLNSK